MNALPLKLNLESLNYTKRSSKFKEQEKNTKLTNLITNCFDNPANATLDTICNQIATNYKQEVFSMSEQN